MIREAINKLCQGEKLSYLQAKQVFLEIMEGKATPAQAAAFLVGLRIKTETTDEMRALAEIMREKSLKLNVAEKGSIVLDTCGTGGKPVKTFNISTCTAFVIASKGIKVAKHGNRSFSGVCGSADVIEGLGIDLSLEPKVVEEAVKEVGIGFLYAPLYHSAMRNVAAVRKEIGIRTIFNIVGPLTNPAGATHQVLGVYSKDLTEKVAKVLRDLKTKRAFVVWGEDTYDEISISAKTKITEVKNKKIRTFYVSPRDFGLSRRSFSQIKGGRVEDNVNSVLGVLSAKPSARLDVVLANASACFVLAGLAKNFKQGVEVAREQIESGAALKKLQELKEFLNSRK
ncbi:MAG: anthranilate phosphoribosyltransferase [Candidatus Omnitrophica bacterium]|nr:anthranilate phosphoribosyltransferase [Candidatus Omnitrophota bacterium]